MTTPTTDEVATVLETAADLYESEQIGWCTGSWIKPEGPLTGPNAVFSACAEGALLLASGYDAKTVWRENAKLFLDSPLAKTARDALKKTVVVPVQNWNDTCIGDRRPTQRMLDGKVYRELTAPNVPMAKAQLVEAMKETAKNLRNRGEASE